MRWLEPRAAWSVPTHAQGSGQGPVALTEEPPRGLVTSEVIFTRCSDKLSSALGSTAEPVPARFRVPPHCERDCACVWGCGLSPITLLKQSI